MTHAQWVVILWCLFLSVHTLVRLGIAIGRWQQPMKASGKYDWGDVIATVMVGGLVTLMLWWSL
jgi:hypothetical protein